jgi:hypothetical protein
MSFDTTTVQLSRPECNLHDLEEHARIISIGRDVKNIIFSKKALRYVEGFSVEKGNKSFAVLDGALYKGGSLFRWPPNKKGSVAIIDGGELYSGAFDDAGRIEKIVLNTTEVPEGAITRCSKLREIVIGSEVKYISEGAFKDLPKLMSIVVSKNNAVYSSWDSCLYKGGELWYIPARLPVRVSRAPYMSQVREHALSDRVSETEFY